MTYSHTQDVPLPILIAAGMVGLLSSAVIPFKSGRTLLLASLAGVGYTFRSLTVTVDDTGLTAIFGGWFAAVSVPLDAMEECRLARMSPLMGWGIHWIGSGWLYNIYGLDAVEISLKDGSKVSIGTDEPERLFSAIRNRLYSPRTA